MNKEKEQNMGEAKRRGPYEVRKSCPKGRRDKAKNEPLDVAGTSVIARQMTRRFGMGRQLSHAKHMR